jgi:hypothetical protein
MPLLADPEFYPSPSRASCPSLPFALGLASTDALFWHSPQKPTLIFKPLRWPVPVFMSQNLCSTKFCLCFLLWALGSSLDLFMLCLCSLIEKVGPVEKSQLLAMTCTLMVFYHSLPQSPLSFASTTPGRSCLDWLLPYNKCSQVLDKERLYQYPKCIMYSRNIHRNNFYNT